MGIHLKAQPFSPPGGRTRKNEAPLRPLEGLPSHHPHGAKGLRFAIFGAALRQLHLCKGVYFSWPQEGTTPSWNLLGIICNEKPSAIFKISGLKTEVGAGLTPGLFLQQAAVAHHALVGISVEPLAQITGLSPAPSTEASTLASFVEFSRAMCDNLFNFASSFAQPPDKIVPVPNEQYLPASVLTKWYENFSRKLKHNPYFWKK